MKKLLCSLLALAMIASLFVATVTIASAGGTNVGKVEEGYTPVVGDSIGSILTIAIASAVALACAVAFVIVKKKENN